MNRFFLLIISITFGLVVIKSVISLEFFNGWANSDIISFCSVVVAFLALFLTIWQSIAIRKHNRLSVQPIIRFAPQVEVSKKGMVLGLYNHGSGPAIITSLSYIVNQKKYELVNLNSFKELINNIGLTDFDFSLSAHTKIKNYVIKAGDETILFKVLNLDGSDLIDSEINKAFIKRLPKFILNYTCIYGRKHSEIWIWESVDNLV